MKADPSSWQTAAVAVAPCAAVTPAVCQHVAAQIAQEKDEPFYVLNVDDIVAKVQHWRDKLPSVQPFYAVKCNNHPLVLKLLNCLGCNFDCASKSEIAAVMRLGVSAERIILANPCKPASHIRYAAAVGVTTMTFDNATELHKISQLMPHAQLVLRIRVDAAVAQCPLGFKFGVRPGDETARLLRLAASLRLRVLGVSFHVGSGCGEPAVYARAVAAAAAVFRQAAEAGAPTSSPPPPTLLDVGGGFSSDIEQFDTAARYLATALATHFPADTGVRVIAEPGRYMVQSAMYLATQVVSLRYRPIALNNNENNNNTATPPTPTTALDVYINDGVYGAFNCVLYDHQVCRPQPLLGSTHTVDNTVLPPGTSARDSVSLTVFGPTCDSFDCVCTAVEWRGDNDSDISVGDWLWWRDMGAYTLSACGGGASAGFNGFAPASCVRALVGRRVMDSCEDVCVTLSDYCSVELLASRLADHKPALPAALADINTDDTHAHKRDDKHVFSGEWQSPSVDTAQCLPEPCCVADY